jgi:outer membrane protein
MWGATAAQNQGSRSAPPPGGIALVDVAYVFKNYNKFNGNYELMKKDVKQREQEIVELQEELKKLVQQKSTFTPDSPNYKQLDQKLAQKKAELELLAANSRDEFTRKEASLYHQTYQEVEAVIQQYADRNGIMLVLRASRDDESKSSNPQEVIKEVSQQVVYSAPGMDITDQVLALLNAKSPTIAAPKDKQQPTGPQRTPTQPTKIADEKGTNKPSTNQPKKSNK